MTAHCCESMTRQLARQCHQHDNPYDCPDAVVLFIAKYQEYGIVVHDGGRASIGIDFCPWCATRLPESQRDRWFGELERRGIDPWAQDIPAEFEDDRWLALPGGDTR
ncbi:DUF6980 family protein [Kitasatospora sp. NPDC059827]|uniref:DUF6980 family protein n=1 Tax=Kitasatospora sp. NPDC059827 TaxID=3346964 RepID=UPI0036643223